jgi:hypothetical protein
MQVGMQANGQRNRRGSTVYDFQPHSTDPFYKWLKIIMLFADYGILWARDRELRPESSSGMAWRDSPNGTELWGAVPKRD